LLNPNSNLAVNRENAEERVKDGVLWVAPEKPPTPEAAPPATGLTWVGWALIGMMLVCVIGAAWPELLRGLRGWSSNSDWSPTVAGPGDEVYVYLPKKITSVKGYWRGTPQVTIRCDEDPKLSGRIPSWTKDNSWGQSIQIGSKESTTSTTTLWVKTRLPSGENYAGKTLKVDVVMNVVYPLLIGNDHFQDTPDTASHSAELRLSAPGSGAAYRASWFGGVLGGGIAMAILGGMMALEAWSLCRLSLPTEVFVPERPAGV
jgi:hypothetical protein